MPDVGVLFWDFGMQEFEAWFVEFRDVLDSDRVPWVGFVEDLFSDGSFFDLADMELCRSAWAVVHFSCKILAF